MIVRYDRAIRTRRRELKKVISVSSGLLVWQGEFGILVVAPNRSRHEFRIHKIHDRIACVTRGRVSAGASLWKPVVNLAFKKAYDYSPGDLFAKDYANVISDALTETWNDPSARLLPSELGFVQVFKDREQDYMAYVGVDGDIQEIGGTRFIGQTSFAEGDGDQSSLSENEVVARLDAGLQALYDPNLSAEQVLDIFRNYKDNPIDSATFKIGQSLFGGEGIQKVEVVVLDRDMVRQKQFREVYRRL